MSLLAYLVSLLLSAAAPGPPVGAQMLFDFRVDSAADWIVVNDAVMGGLSQSSFTKPVADFASFTGDVSLRNNGGFASVRTRLAERLDGWILPLVEPVVARHRNDALGARIRRISSQAA